MNIRDTVAKYFSRYDDDYNTTLKKVYKRKKKKNKKSGTVVAGSYARGKNSAYQKALD